MAKIIHNDRSKQCGDDYYCHISRESILMLYCRRPKGHLYEHKDGVHSWTNEQRNTAKTDRRIDAGGL